MEKDLANQVALVTGGTSGIGKTAAIALAKAGAKVVVSGRREKEGQETVSLIEKQGGMALFVKCDITKESDIASCVEKTVKTFGGLSIAFNNAGLEGEQKYVTEVTEEDYKKIFDVNVKGVLLSMKYEIPHMLQKGGSIINTSSVAGLIGLPTSSIYCASKSAVISLSKTAALEYAKKKIRVNAICPAAIQTEMLDRFTGGNDTAFAKEFTALHPVGRVGTSEEVASLVVYLASPLAAFITGQAMVVDGGFTAQ